MLNRFLRIRKVFPQLHTQRYVQQCYKSSSSSPADPSIFAGSRTGDFFQDAPTLKNQYLDDTTLVKYLKRILPDEVYSDIHDDLIQFGDSVSTTIHKHHVNVCNNEPLLQQYNAWGNRVDDIIMHPSWKELHDVAAREKLISIPYKNEYHEWSRLYQIAKLYLFSPSSGLYSCPLAMTDGAASILQRASKEPFVSAFRKLTSNDPVSFWTSGQWMTEKQGGSDVGMVGMGWCGVPLEKGNGTETLAVYQPSDDTYKLYGYKWFTSATDANMALTLARIVDENGNVKKGSKGLTMFYLETRNSDGHLNGISIEKLKKKLGTRQMPTAELILDGTVAHQVSDVGRGIASISPMLTITRIHNSLFAVSNMRRLLSLSKDFSQKRQAFGSLLSNHPLHVQTLARMEIEQRGGFFLLMKVAHLLGLYENKKATDQEKLLLRLLTPLLKLYTGKQAVSVATEGLESFGGHGYLEDTGLPTYLRDGQVLSIWEGTTNVLSLDVLRSITKTKGEVLNAFFNDIQQSLSNNSNTSTTLQQCCATLTKATTELQHFIKDAQTKDEAYMIVGARDFSYSLTRVYIGSLLYKNAIQHPDDKIDAHIANRWVHMHDLVPVTKNHHLYDMKSCNIDHEIVYES